VRVTHQDDRPAGVLRFRHRAQRVDILEELVESRDVNAWAGTPPMAAMVERVDRVARSREAGAHAKVAPGMLGEAVQDEENGPRASGLPGAEAEAQPIAGRAGAIDARDRSHQTGTLAARSNHVKRRENTASMRNFLDTHGLFLGLANLFLFAVVLLGVMANQVRRGEGGCTVRTAVAVLGLFTLGAGASIPVVAGERVVPVASDTVTIERIMALAETDLNLRRADLGLIGAVLPAAPLATPSVAVSRVARVRRVHEVTAVPAPAASPAVEAVPAVQSQR
jgi:hypothetical protein